jgi:hypothetical protein
MARSSANPFLSAVCSDPCGGILLATDYGCAGKFQLCHNEPAPFDLRPSVHLSGQRCSFDISQSQRQNRRRIHSGCVDGYRVIGGP